MTTNRIQHFLAKDNFDFGNLLTEQNLDALFEGPSVNELIEREVTKARKEGYDAAVKDYFDGIRQRVETHVKNIFTTGLNVARACKSNLPNLLINQVRAKYSVEPNYVNMLFVISSSLDDQVKFTEMLSSFETFMLNEVKIYGELFYINDKFGNVDHGILKSESNYPFHINVSSFLNADK